MLIIKKIQKEIFNLKAFIYFQLERKPQAGWEQNKPICTAWQF